MNRIKIQFYLVFILLSIIIQTTFAANIFWDGGGGDNLWTTSANWSDDNIPGSDDDVIIGISARVLLTGADGVAKSIIINSGDTLEVASGFLLDVVEDVTIHGVLSLLGTAGMNLGGDWIRTGVFNPNSSTVIFDENQIQKLKLPIYFTISI